LVLSKIRKGGVKCEDWQSYMIDNPYTKRA